MAICLLGIGTNQGRREDHLQRAIDGLQQHSRVKLVQLSSIVGSNPIGGPPGQPAFLNAAATIETDLAPEDLLAYCQSIESSAGRLRGDDTPAWSARPLDLDLLLYDDQTLDLPYLQIPHPLLVARRFVLEPANEISPDWVHPRLRLSISELWRHLNEAEDRFALLTTAPESAAQLIARASAVQLVEGPSPAGRWGDSAVPEPSPLVESARAAVESLSSQLWSGPQIQAKSREQADRAPSRTTGCLSDFWIEEWSRPWLEKAIGTRFPERLADALCPIAPIPLPKLVLIPQADESYPGFEFAEAEAETRAIELGIPFVRIQTRNLEDVVRIASGAILAMKRVFP